MTEKRIVYPHGIPVGHPPVLVGSGYGKNERGSQAADACAEWLVAHLGQDVEVPGNGNGESAGAFRNGDSRWESWYGLEAQLDEEGGLVYSASFAFPLNVAAAVEAALERDGEKQKLGMWVSEDDFLNPPHHGKVCAGGFASLEQAGWWLIRHGVRFCAEIRRALWNSEQPGFASGTLPYSRGRALTTRVRDV